MLRRQTHTRHASSRLAASSLVLVLAVSLCLAAVPLSTAGSVLPADNDYYVPKINLARGIAHLGSLARMRRAFQKVLKGEPVKIAVTGGSIAAGAGAFQDGKNFLKWAQAWSERNFPGLFVWVNGAAGATTTNYMSLCVENHVHLDADVVIVEYTLNNRDFWKHGEIFNTDKTRSMERLIRRLLNYPKKPAVILLNAFCYIDGFPFRGAFWGGSVERDTPDLGLFYDLPVLSVKGCCYHAMKANLPGYRVDNTVSKLPADTPLEVKSQYFYMDNVHPYGVTGHRVMGDLISFLFEQVFKLMQAGVWAHTDNSETLPDPIVPGNFESKTNKCFTNVDVQKVVRSFKGFAWIDESRVKGYHKWGFVSTSAGDELILELNTLASNTNGTPDQKWKVRLQIIFLRSYNHMGVAKISCIEGCSCEATTFDGHYTTDRHSLWFTHDLYVSQHAACQVKVLNTNETNSGEHKVKVVGVMVGDEAREVST